MADAEYIEPNQLVPNETYKIYDNYRTGAFVASEYNVRQLPIYTGVGNEGNPTFLVNIVGRGVVNKSFNPTHYKFKSIKMGGDRNKKEKKNQNKKDEENEKEEDI